MKEIFVADLVVGQPIISFFMVNAIAIKKDSRGRNYLNLTLADRTGSVDGKKWDLADEEVIKGRSINPGDLVKIDAQVEEFKGMKQLKVNRIRMTNKEDALVLKDFIKAAPEDGESMFLFLRQAAEEFKDPDLRGLCLDQLDSWKEKLLYYPAASKNHHAEMCGLLWHMKRMLMAGQALCTVYTDLDRDLVCTGVLLHDLQKMVEIRSNEYGVSDGYSFEGNMLGHIVMGVREIDKVMDRLGFPEEKKIMVEHMILSHHYEPEYGSPVRPLFPEAELLHYLDVMDAKLFDMEEALTKTPAGSFSDRVWTLNNRCVYKRIQED